MWQMINAAREKNYDKNTLKILADAVINSFHILSNERLGVLMPNRQMLCENCTNQDHEIDPDKNSSHDSAVLKFLLLNNHKNPNNIILHNISPPSPRFGNQSAVHDNSMSSCLYLNISRVREMRENTEILDRDDTALSQNLLTERLENNPDVHEIFVDIISKDMLEKLFCDEKSEIVCEEKFIKVTKEKFGLLNESFIDAGSFKIFFYIPSTI